MSRELTKKEIYERMIEWRNLKKLHQADRARIAHDAEVILALKESSNQDRGIIAQQAKTIQALQVRVEELERMVFGRKKKKPHGEDAGEDTPSSDQKPRTPRPGTSYHRPVPKTVTDTVHHPVDTCPDCGAELEQKQTRTYYEEDILLPTTGGEKERFHQVIKHEIEREYCPSCKHWHNACSLPCARVTFGTNIRIYVSTCALLIRLSYDQIRTMLAQLYGIEVSDGELAKILDAEGTTFRSEHTAIIETIRAQHAAHYDETVWPTTIGGIGNYGWALVSVEGPEEAFLLGESRGKGVTERLKGGSTHVGVSDHYGAYDNLFDHHQLCWAHPHRKFRDLAQSEKLSEGDRIRSHEAYETFGAIYADLRTVLTTPFEKERYAQERIRLLARFDLFTQEDPRDFHILAKRKAELRRGRDSYFTCLLFPCVPCDNNPAERAIRHVVLKRRNSFGSKTGRGAKAAEVLLTVLKTLKNKKPTNFFGELLAMRARCVALQRGVKGV